MNGFFNQIAGNTGQTDVRYTGLQAALAPSTAGGQTRWLFGDGDEASEASLTVSDNFRLEFIDRAVTTAKVSTPLIRPLKVGGEDFFVMFLHPYQVHNLRTDATANRITWFDTQKARIQGGQNGESTNPIFSGALGVYNGVILHESVRVPSVVANTRRAILCGAQAALMAFGQGQKESDSPNWYEEMFDYGNQLGVSGGMIAGLKKSVFNSIDFGTIVLSTRAVAP